MAKFTLQVGETIDVLTAEELQRILIEEDVKLAARAAGFKWHESALPVTPAAPTFQIGGPAPGFAWKLRLVSVSLAAAGSFGLFKGEAASGLTNRPVGNPQSTSVLGTLNIGTIFYPDDIVVHTDQQVFILATQNIISFYFGAVQVPGERLSEHLS